MPPSEGGMLVLLQEFWCLFEKWQNSAELCRKANLSGTTSVLLSAHPSATASVLSTLSPLQPIHCRSAWQQTFSEFSQTRFVLVRDGTPLMEILNSDLLWVWDHMSNFCTQQCDLCAFVSILAVTILLYVFPSHTQKMDVGSWKSGKKVHPVEFSLFGWG